MGNDPIWAGVRRGAEVDAIDPEPGFGGNGQSLQNDGGQFHEPTVYSWCMSRTNIDIDDALCRQVMERFHLSTKREAVNLALRHLAGEPLDLVEARSLRGSGWEGDLAEMRSART